MAPSSPRRGLTFVVPCNGSFKVWGVHSSTLRGSNRVLLGVPWRPGWWLPWPLLTSSKLGGHNLLKFDKVIGKHISNVRFSTPHTVHGPRPRAGTGLLEISRSPLEPRPHDE